MFASVLFPEPRGFEGHREPSAPEGWIRKILYSIRQEEGLFSGYFLLNGEVFTSTAHFKPKAIERMANREKTDPDYSGFTGPRRARSLPPDNMCPNKVFARKDAGLYCGSRLLEGRSVCLCWAKSKPKGPKGDTSYQQWFNTHHHEGCTVEGETFIFTTAPAMHAPGRRVFTLRPCRTWNTVELIPTLGALSPRGGPVQDPVLTCAPTEDAV